MSDPYHKIQSVYKRDPQTNHKTFLDEFSLDAFGYLAGSQWEWTEKVDGTNIRVQWSGAEVSFAGRSDNANIPGPLVEHLIRTFTPEVLGRVFGEEPGTLYGEGFGGKIQKAGATYGGEQRFVLFDVRCGGLWLQRDNVAGVACSLDCPVVPVVGGGTIAEAVEWVKSAPYSTWGDFCAGGIVLRPRVELLTRRGERVIAKLKVKDFPS